jgi:Flp pilus assembly protein TadG
MGTNMSSAAAERSPRKRISMRGVRLGAQDGQSLILVVLAMSMIILIAALAIDVATWYQKHHSAQVAADSSALAAANCLANSSPSNQGSNTCTTVADANANTVATTMAANNGYTLSSPSNVTLGFDSVTVTVPTTAPALFAGLASIAHANISARAVARFYPAGETFGCSSSGSNSCISFFAGNPNCPPSPNSSPYNQTIGLDLVTNDHGSGKSAIPDAYTNGYYYNGANSGASSFGITLPGTNGTPKCTPETAKANTSTYSYVSQSQLPYPAVWTQPTGAGCTYTSTYWTTNAVVGHQITAPGVYCVSGNPAPSCQNNTGGMTAGYTYLDEASSSLTASGWYEFVSPCTILSNSGAPAISTIPGQPLIYGTANITTYATSSLLPTCSDAANLGTSGSDLFINGNNGSISSPIYDQCGTVELTQNNNYLGYVEAWNIIVDKNNSVTGNGPTSPGGGGVTTQQPGDALSG